MVKSCDGRRRHLAIEWPGVPVSADGEDGVGCDGGADRVLVAARSRAIEHIGSHRLLDAADYGIPQHRLRAVIVITRDGERFTWPRATNRYQPLCAWDAIGTLVSDEPLPEPVGSWADLLPSIPEGQNYLWHTSRGGGRPLFGYRTRFWSFLLKLAKDQPSWTLPVQPGPSTGPFHWDNRPLTITEMLRLQSFDADWLVDGLYRERVRQVGNATPPRASLR